MLSTEVNLPTLHIPSAIVRDANKSIWVEFMALAEECRAVNLCQGMPDTPMPEFLSKHLSDVAMHPECINYHQYTRSYGHPRLVNILGKMYSNLLNTTLNPLTDVLITVGAFLALYYSFHGWLNPGDEVIIFEPAFDSYITQIRMAGGVPVPVVLELDKDAKTSSGYKLDLEVVKSKLTQKTKMLVLNNPVNPTGKLFSRKELEGLAQIVIERNLLVVSDEVYEWMVYPGNEMVRFASIPQMFDRTITIGTAGKTFSATGWKLGWAIGPKWLLEPLKKVHENCVFTCSTPTQEALARALEQEHQLMEGNKSKESYLMSGLISELQNKRDLLAKYLTSAGFRPIVPEAGYFMIADFSHLDGPFKKHAEESDEELDFHFVRWLCREKKLAAIPPSAFYSRENRKGNDHFIRLCFLKKEETLDDAVKILETFTQKS